MKSRLNHRSCLNCDAYVEYGAFCWDCVRAFLVGAAGAFGTALAAWWVRTL